MCNCDKCEPVKQLSSDYAGAVISDGTLLDSDLFSAFISVLEEADPAAAKQTQEDWDAAVRDNDDGCKSYIVQEMFDSLNNIAPDGCWFGASEGDGACFGFWTDDDEEAEQVVTKPENLIVVPEPV